MYCALKIFAKSISISEINENRDIPCLTTFIIVKTLMKLVSFTLNYDLQLILKTLVESVNVVQICNVHGLIKRASARFFDLWSGH